MIKALHLSILNIYYEFHYLLSAQVLNLWLQNEEFLDLNNI